MKRSSLCAVLLTSLLAIVLWAHRPPPPADNPPNILFIAVDDLRPELGCYGADHIHSPHIDGLAAEGSLFLNSYCNIPVCGASRASLLTGLRPTLTRFKRYYCRADEDAPGVTTIPGFFKSHGYTTISNGKISHNAADNKQDWDEIWKPKAKSPRDFMLPKNIALDTMKESRGAAYEAAAVQDSAYRDGKIAVKSMQDLAKLKKGNKPFFLGVGFLKPHLPFNAPQKYWDLYNRNNITLPDNRNKPTDVPQQALHNSGELRHYAGVPPKGPVSDSLATSLIHGYYACVSYTDAQIGKLLDKLEQLDLMKNTIVILWGDHGWNLLEHGLWCKHSNYRTSLKAPIIIRSPDTKGGQKHDEMVEFVDIYPTLCDLAGKPLPGHLEGNSLLPLMKGEQTTWKKQVESVWNNGFTYTSHHYGYTQWRDDQDSILHQMLFDHKKDPGENVNIIRSPEGQSIVDQWK